MKSALFMLVATTLLACGSSTTVVVPSGDSGPGITADASADAVADAPPDALPKEAGACPIPMPSRRDACATLNQICFYSCGTVFSCTAQGWDYDTAVDGGPPCP